MFFLNQKKIKQNQHLCRKKGCIYSNEVQITNILTKYFLNQGSHANDVVLYEIFKENGWIFENLYRTTEGIGPVKVKCPILMYVSKCFFFFNGIRKFSESILKCWFNLISFYCNVNSIEMAFKFFIFFFCFMRFSHIWKIKILRQYEA